MNAIAPATVLEQLNWRYAVKKFDSSKRIDEVTWQALEESMILAPSSYGLQPWKFIVVTDEELKAQLPAASWNQQQPKDCSHMVVMAALESIDAAYVESYLQDVVDKRGLPAGAMDGYRKTLVARIEQMETHFDWNCRQVYIALGQLMMTAAMVAIDTCPMEGIDAAAYDKILGIAGTGFRSVVGCAVGYRHSEDLQATAKKVRFSPEHLVQRL